MPTVRSKWGPVHGGTGGCEQVHRSKGDTTSASAEPGVVQEPRRAGQSSLTNIIRIIDSGWLSWLRLGGRFQSRTTAGTIEPRPQSLGIPTGAPGVSGMKFASELGASVT